MEYQISIESGGINQNRVFGIAKMDSDEPGHKFGQFSCVLESNNSGKYHLAFMSSEAPVLSSGVKIEFYKPPVWLATLTVI